MTIRSRMLLLTFIGLIGTAGVARAANVAYSDVQAIFTAKCVGCHGGSGGLSLASPGSYGNMVMVFSNANGAQYRVKPFDAANSNLFVKVNTGGSMNSYLNAGDITTIQNWINQGASTTYTVTPASSSAVVGSDVGITAQLKNMNGVNVSLSGVTVTWSKTGGGSFSGATSNTDGSGVATVTLTTGTSAGVTQTVTATTSASTGTSGSIAITAGPASKYKVTSSSGTASPGTSVLITAQLVDANNNSVSTAGLTVNWTSTNGGTLQAPSSQTNASGAASINFTVGTTIGTTYTVTATDTNSLTGTSGSIKVSASGSVELVSAKPDGTVSVAITSHIGTSPHSLSNDGRYMIFFSDATDLTAEADTNGAFDLYVRDIQSGTTKLVSINAAGTAAGDSGADPGDLPQISGNGRYVVFGSYSTNLISPAPSAHRHIYRRDLQTNTTVIIDASTAGVVSDGDSSSPVITDDGRYIAFVSVGTNLTTPAGSSDVYWHDCESNTTLLVSINLAGTGAGSSGSSKPSISADGKYVAFGSIANNLVPPSGVGINGDIYRRDMVTNGASSTVLCSCRTGTTNVAGDNFSLNPVINATGQYVIFESLATNLVTNDTNGQRDIFRRDCTNNVTINCSSKDGTTVSGTPNADMGPALISADGRYVVFKSSKVDLVANDTNNSTDIFRRDCDTNATILVSAKNGTTSPSLNGVNSPPGGYSMSSDARFVIFSSASYDLTSNVSHAGYQIYRRDIVTNSTLLCSVGLDDSTGTSDSQNAFMSADGSRVGFESYANNLITQSTGSFKNIFAISVNSAPQITALADGTGSEGTSFTQGGTFADANSLDTFAVMADYGDGTALQTVTSTGQAFTLSHVYADNGTYQIKFTVTDNHGATANGTQNVTISNVAPTAAINNAPSTGTVGTAISLSSTVSDPGTNDTLTYAWSVTKDGAAYGAGSAASYSLTPDGAGSYVVTLTVTDKDGGSGTSASATIGVAKPDGFAGAPTAITDSNPAAGVTSYLWDFGDGSPTVTTTTPNVEHVYAAPGTYTVTETETDGSGVQTVKTFTVVVGGPISSLDNDGDGFPDELEKGVGSSPADPKSTPFNIVGPVTATALTAPKTGIKLNFVKAGTDSITVAGTLPHTAGFVLAGSGVAVDVGGATQSFTLDAKGGAKNGKTSSFKITIPKNKTAGKFKATLKGNYASAFTDEGLSGASNVKKSTRTVTIYIVFENTLYKAPVTMTYGAKAGKSASAKY